MDRSDGRAASGSRAATGTAAGRTAARARIAPTVADRAVRWWRRGSWAIPPVVVGSGTRGYRNAAIWPRVTLALGQYRSAAQPPVMPASNRLSMSASWVEPSSSRKWSGLVGRRQVERPDEEARHLGARHGLLGAVAVRGAAAGDAGGGQAVDAGLAGQAVVVGEEVLVGGGQVHRAVDEHRHLEPGDRVAGAEQVEIAAAGDGVVVGPLRSGSRTSCPASR